MSTADTTVLRAGEALTFASLVSPGGTYALEHRSDGRLVLCDRVAGRDVWAVGSLEAEPGRLVLLPDGRLVLEVWPGVPVWISGDVDKRVVAASVTDQGRLVLTDPDGGLRWSRDPLTEADLAAHRPADGDRLLPGQVLAGPVFSPNGRYRLTHDADEGETRLDALRADRVRGVWSRHEQTPGPLTLGTDGVLRTGTDSMTLLRWTGRYRQDPMAVRISAAVVRDQGDLVLLDQNGEELYDSRTAAEEARLAALEQAENRRRAREVAKRRRPAGSGLPRDWYDLLDLAGPSTLALVEHTDPHEVLCRLGASPETIRLMTYQELLKATEPDEDDDPPHCAFAVRVGDRVVVVEPCGREGVKRAEELSRGGSAVVRYLDFDGWSSLAWYRDGVLLARYGEDDDDLLAEGASAIEGTDPAAFVPHMERIGLGTHQDGGSDEFLPADVELACLAADVRPRVKEFEGACAAAVFATWYW
ncbi:DUF6461 domain-containing protein [Streptomyces sp. NPDC093516]|uniref:DUF6461 domain-containing protein n=1 Tax=Streptomyces sp. NPDC093516 TaxID=3155304 RepID=UPI0034391068